MLNAEITHQYLDLVPALYNFHMLEGCCAFWQILEHAAVPLLPQPLSEDEKNTLGNAVGMCSDFLANYVIINCLSGVFRSRDDRQCSGIILDEHNVGNQCNRNQSTNVTHKQTISLER